ncbi:AbrB/MazE/SpoVT family DNA-binding domain-containing protein [Candidatus Micrarchaeota archaeon]|nr:AbrB/MazE/SpoVT family DNA-binding domain-containing protein [Candidatus Micrarchaeota archaeon]
MNLEGKTCGVCNKGKLRAFQDEVVPGVYVDAFKCSEYGHVSYSKEVMKHVENLYKQSSEERHIVKVGSSIAVPIPAAIVRLLNLRASEKVFITTQDNKIIIKPSPA